jgi:hypothetical protein
LLPYFMRLQPDRLYEYVIGISGCCYVEAMPSPEQVKLLSLQ